jgi:type IV secretion system protein VirD4
MKALIHRILGWVCGVFCFAGIMTALVGCVLIIPSVREDYVSMSPYIRLYADRLQPHAVQMIVVGAIVIAVAVLCNLGLKDATLATSRMVGGSARFATWWEIWREGYAASKKKPRFVLGKSTLFQTVALTAWRMFEHVIVLAPSGQGKTSRIIKPNLLQETGERGLLVNDTKGELYQTCAGALSQRMPVTVFAPHRLDISAHYNPLANVHNERDAEDLARAWVENTGLSTQTFWNDTAILLIQAFIMHLHDTAPTAPFSRLADLLGVASISQIHQVLSNSKSKVAHDLGATFMDNIKVNPQRAADVVSGMATRFMSMRNPELRELTTMDPDPEKNLDFQRLAREPQALFLWIDPPDVQRLKPVSACLIMQLMNVLVRSSIHVDFVFYLDELCNAGRIPRYVEYISQVRSMGLSFVQCVQDFGQLRREYGQDGVDTILSNSNTKIFLPGVGKKESEYASELLGDMTVKTTSLSRGRNGVTQREASTTRRLMKPDEIRRMRQGDLVVVASNLAPMKLRNRPYYKVRRLRKLSKLPMVYKSPQSQGGGQNGQPGGPAPAPAQSGAQRVVQQIIQIVQHRPSSSGQVKP